MKIKFYEFILEVFAEVEREEYVFKVILSKPILEAVYQNMKRIHTALLTLSLLFTASFSAFANAPTTDIHKKTILPSHHHPLKKPSPHANLIGADEPDNDTLNNLMLRETIHNDSAISVDPFTGNFKFLLHLINIKLNDGLHLQFSINNSNANFFYDLQWKTAPFGDHTRAIPGISNPNVWSKNHQDFLFTDPAGNLHHFYLHIPRSPQASTYLSTDGWIAQLYPSPAYIEWRGGTTAYGNYYIGYIRAPNGTTYNISHLTGLFSAVNSITSPHGGASIHYHYNPAGQLTQIQASNGYTVNLSYTEDHITVTTSDNHSWILYFDADKWLSAISLPDGHSWQFLHTTIQGDHVKRTGWTKVTTPGGLTLTAIRRPINNAVRIKFPIIALTYSGQGIPNSTWTYQYGSAAGDPAITTVVNNYDKRIIYTFSNGYRNNQPLWNTGLILSKKIYNG